MRRLTPLDRIALVKLAHAAVVTGNLRRTLTDTAGDDFLIRGTDGHHRLPYSFRVFLRSIATADIK